MMQDIRGNPINTGDIVYLVTINKDLSFTPIALRAVQSILHSPGMISLETKDGQRRVHHQSHPVPGGPWLLQEGRVQGLREEQPLPLR